MQKAVESFIKAYNDHDITALGATLADDAEIIVPATVFHGKAEIVNHFALTFQKLIPDIHEEVLAMTVQGAMAALEVCETGTFHNPMTGVPKPYSIKCAYLIHTNGEGLIDRAHSYWDTYPWSQQVGLPIEVIHKGEA